MGVRNENGWEGRERSGKASKASTYTTICLRPRRALRMNLRVRRVTGCSLSAMLAVCDIWSVCQVHLKLSHSSFTVIADLWRSLEY